MRYVVLAALVALACRGERAASTHPEAAGPRPAAAGHPSGISDDELVAFTRWQREYAELLGRQRAEIDALTRYDPSKPFDQALAEAPRAAAAATARFAPVLQELLGRQPLTGAKAELATEAPAGGAGARTARQRRQGAGRAPWARRARRNSTRTSPAPERYISA